MFSKGIVIRGLFVNALPLQIYVYGSVAGQRLHTLSLIRTITFDN